MHWRCTFEHHLGRLEGVLIGESELQSENLALVQASLSSLKSDMPYQLLLVDDLEFEQFLVIVLQILFFFVQPLK